MSDDYMLECLARIRAQELAALAASERRAVCLRVARQPRARQPVPRFRRWLLRAKQAVLPFYVAWNRAGPG